MAVKLAIVGAAGRMGKRILSLAAESSEFEIVCAAEAKGHCEIGADAGQVAGLGALGVAIADRLCRPADVAIDFSLPDATDQTLAFCQESDTALVLGTTGLSAQQRSKVEVASQKIPVAYATNMSVGMNLLFSLVGKVAEALGEDYDIEIVEHHHRFKKDAPSGSALTLAQRICQATGKQTERALVHGRSGKDALRRKGTVGLHAVRAGDITGVHSVMYSTLGETVTLGHTAHSRDTFVRGALRAAQWLVGKNPGLYSMADVLGIT